MAYDESNIFAKILREEIPCDKIYEDDYVLAFNDIAPQAPVHVLVIPKGAYESIDDFGARATSEEITGLARAIAKLSQDLNLKENGFRAIANTGEHGGQEVPHYHVHLLGGAPLGSMLAA